MKVTEGNISNRRITTFIIYNKCILTCWYRRDKWCSFSWNPAPDAEETDVADWLQGDENDLGYTHFDDQEIVKFVANCEQDNDAANNDEDDDNDDDVCDGGQGSQRCIQKHFCV